MGAKDKSKKADWRANSTEVYDRDGFAWAKSVINCFDHRRLDDVQIGFRYHHANERTDIPVRGIATRPPPRSRKIGWHLSVSVRTGGIPGRMPIHLPPLYRRDGGVWECAEAARDYAVLWDNDVLDAYAAIVASGEGEVLARTFADEHRMTDARRAWLGDLTELPTKNGHQETVFVYGSIYLRSLDDAIVFGVGQSAFDWLRATKQIGGRRSNHGRDNFAWGLLGRYRKHVSARRRRKAKAKRVPGMPGVPRRKIIPGFPGAGGDQ